MPLKTVRGSVPILTIVSTIISHYMTEGRSPISAQPAFARREIAPQMAAVMLHHATHRLKQGAFAAELEVSRQQGKKEEGGPARCGTLAVSLDLPCHHDDTIRHDDTIESHRHQLLYSGYWEAAPAKHAHRQNAVRCYNCTTCACNVAVAS